MIVPVSVPSNDKAPWQGDYLGALKTPMGRSMLLVVRTAEAILPTFVRQFNLPLPKTVSGRCKLGGYLKRDTASKELHRHSGIRVKRRGYVKRPLGQEGNLSGSRLQTHTSTLQIMSGG